MKYDEMLKCFKDNGFDLEHKMYIFLRNVSGLYGFCEKSRRYMGKT